MKKLLFLSFLSVFVLAGFAYAELDLSDYPSPFIVGNTFNGILVVGDTASVESVIGATDIATSLQYVNAEVKFILGEGAVIDKLLDGETKTYTFNGKDYEITLNFVDADEVQFVINGQTSRKMKDGDTDKLSDGTTIGVLEIQYSVLGTKKVQVGAIKLDSEVADVAAQNIISVGSPCENSVTAEIMGNPPDCHKGFEVGKGSIQLFDTGAGNTALVVAGYNPVDTRNAAVVVANYQDYKGNFKGTKVEVKKVNNQLTVAAPATTEEESTILSIITIPDKDVYNIGDTIGVSVSIIEEQNYEGLLIVTIECSSYSLQYYLSPLSLEANVMSQIEVPVLNLSNYMIGKCRLKARFQTTDGKRIDETTSNEFEVTSEKQSCVAEWKCDGNYKYLQNSNCSISNRELCSYGCMNGVCNPYERRICVNGVAYWYKGDSLQEKENCWDKCKDKLNPTAKEIEACQCFDGKCGKDCVSHYKLGCCDNTEICYFDSCGNKEEEIKTCYPNACSNGFCVQSACVPSWSCGSWFSCVNGKQTRSCIDTKCNAGSKTETQSCTVNYNFNDYPLILVHGLWSDASSMNELKSDLTEYYSDKGIFNKEPDCQSLTSLNKPIIMSYQYYPDKLSLQTIQSFSYDFSKFINRVLECTGAPKIDIIAHSLGGIISRYSIKEYNSKVNKLIMLGTPNQKFFLGICQYNDGKKRIAAEYQLLQGDIFDKLNVPPEACCGTDYFVIRGNSCNFGDVGSDGVVTIDGTKLNGANWIKDVNCAHAMGYGNDKPMTSPSNCPQAYDYIIQALGKSTTSSTPTANVVNTAQTTTTSQPTTTKTKYCCSRFLGFLWCTRYCYR